MDPKRQLFNPGKSRWRRQRKQMFARTERSKLFSRSK
jgi:hypothetical protein